MCDDIKLNNFVKCDRQIVIDYFENTIVGDILCPLLLIKDSFYAEDYIQRIRYYKNPIVRAILYCTNIQHKSVLYEIYYDYLNLLINDITDDYIELTRNHENLIFPTEINKLTGRLFEVMEWLILWYWKKKI